MQRVAETPDNGRAKRIQPIEYENRLGILAYSVCIEMKANRRDPDSVTLPGTMADRSIACSASTMIITLHLATFPLEIIFCIAQNRGLHLITQIDTVPK